MPFLTAICVNLRWSAAKYENNVWSNLFVFYIINAYYSFQETYSLQIHFYMTKFIKGEYLSPLRRTSMILSTITLVLNSLRELVQISVDWVRESIQGPVILLLESQSPFLLFLTWNGYFSSLAINNIFFISWGEICSVLNTATSSYIPFPMGFLLKYSFTIRLSLISCMNCQLFAHYRWRFYTSLFNSALTFILSRISFRQVLSRPKNCWSLIGITRESVHCAIRRTSP